MKKKACIPFKNSLLNLFALICLCLILNSGCTHDSLPVPEALATSVDQGMSFTWTAFKYTNRAGVSGTFDDIDVTIPNEYSSNAATILDGVEFNINTASLNSGSTFRDDNILKYFFSQLVKGDLISGTITTTESSIYRSTGTCSISLNINQVERDIEADFSLIDNTLLLKGNVDLSLWDAQPALDSLNQQVIELHTGTDGINKLWPDVQFKVEMPIMN